MWVKVETFTGRGLDLIKLRQLKRLRWQFLLILIGYLPFYYSLLYLDITNNIIEISNILVYFIIVNIVVVSLLLFYSVKNVYSKDKQAFLFMFFFILFGGVLIIGWIDIVKNIYNKNGEVSSYYTTFKNVALLAKFFFVINLIWMNYRKYLKLNLIKHILETLLVVCIYVLYILEYFQTVSNNELILNLVDLGITYYIIIFIYLSYRKNILQGIIKGSPYLYFMVVGILLCITDMYASIYTLEDKWYVLGFFIGCVFYTFIVMVPLDSAREYTNGNYKIVDNITIRTYHSIKDTSVALLDATLFVYILNVMLFTKVEFSIFVIALLVISGRHILIGMQRDGDEYDLSDNVVFVDSLSKIKLYQLGIDRTDEMFTSSSRGVIIFDNEKNPLAYNKIVEEVLQEVTLEGIVKRFKSIDAAIVMDAVHLAYEGIPQEVSARELLDESSQNVYEVMIVPIWREEVVSGIEFIITDYRVKYTRKTSLSGLAYLDHTAYKANLDVFIESIEQNPKGVLVSIALIDYESLRNTQSNRIVNKIVLDFLSSIENIVPENTVIFHESEAGYILYMQETREKVLRICQKIYESNYWNMNILGSMIMQDISQGIIFYEDMDGTVEDWIHKVNLTRSISETNKVPFVIYEGEVKKQIESRYFIQNTLKDSMEKKELFMVYQPKVDSSTGKIVSLEALVRWLHPEKGFILPGEFIPVTEESNEISILGMYIFEEVVRQQVEWREQGIHVVPVAVNISTKQFKDINFLDKILNLYENYPLEKGDIAIELTERDDITEDLELIELLHRLREIGYDIQIDDFGAGKTVLASLAELPITTVKLDRSIVSRIEEPVHRQIVDSVKRIADLLGIAIVAEGVERIEEVQILRSLDCNIIQGYYYYKPLSVEEIAQLLIKQHEDIQKNIERIIHLY